ncbi:MAG: SRPBCC family protein [Acidiferrobacterales bacterium]
MRNAAACLLLLFIVATVCASACAGGVTIRMLEVTRSDDTYVVNFDVLLATTPAAARAILSDYKNWPRLAENMGKPTLVKTFADGRQRIRLSIRSCVLFMCQTIRQLKDVWVRRNGDIVSVMISGESDFRSGRERWQIEPEQGRTRVRYHAEFVPSFSLLPLIGPWILKRELRQTLINIATNLEALAAP